uniref:Ubiquitin carboxyl-terminal hydrolase n=1 Tax=Timema genevievae TaxID=629358 RepID=A0A7R9JZ93_TIMGE|nr:unnamed protein product [Timema genevievae]
MTDNFQPKMGPQAIPEMWLGGKEGLERNFLAMEKKVKEIQSGIQAMNIQKCPEVEEIQSGIHAMNIQKCPEVEHIHDCIETRSRLNGCDSLDIEVMQNGIEKMKISSFGAQDVQEELGEDTSPVSDDKQIIFSKTDEILLECGSDILGSSVENGLKNEKNHEHSNIVNLNSSPQTKSSQSLKLNEVLNWEHQLKWIQWNKKRTPIVTQNSNGPCPLIAISNVLLLCRKIILPSVMEFITANQLLEFVADSIFENIPKDLSGVCQLNYEQNVYDAIAILPHLHTGLDVNVKFTGVQDFEYTPECIIFDLLNIPLYHGWLVDPQAQETVKSLGNLGYNQLVENIVINKDSTDSELFSRAVIAEEFLEKTASQLTYHGLCELNSALRNDELAVFFRNNHFSTIVKKKNELFQLVTDQGFLHEPRVVWESLSNIENDGYFVDGHFVSVPQNALETSSVITHQQLIGQE